MLDNYDMLNIQLSSFSLPEAHKNTVNQWLSNKIQSSLNLNDIFELSEEDYKTLITIFNLYRQSPNTYAFYFSGAGVGRGTAIIPEHLIKYFEVSKPSNKVHIFDRIQGTFQTHKLVEEYVKNSNINNSIYIYETNNRNLFKFLDQSIDFNYTPEGRMLKSTFLVFNLMILKYRVWLKKRYISKINLVIFIN
jgi:hypothetical protein